MRFGPCIAASVECTPDAQERSRLGGVAGERPGLRICCPGSGFAEQTGTPSAPASASETQDTVLLLPSSTDQTG